MDLLVLDRVLAALDGTLRGAVLLEIREGAEGRFRILAAPSGGRPLPFTIGLDPERPWIGRPVPRRGREVRRPPTPFAAACSRALDGAAITGFDRVGDDRIAQVRTSTGHRLIAELTRGPTVVLVGPEGTVLDAARRPRASAGRLAQGATYAPPPLPPGRLPVLRAEAEEVDRLLRERTAAGQPLEDALRGVLFGIGRDTAELLVREARRGASPGSVLALRRERLRAGDDAPCVVGSDDPMADAEAGRLAPGVLRLLPWFPEDGVGVAGSDAAGTAGLYHEAAGLAAGLASRAGALRTIVRREIARLWDAERKAASDAAGFADPERHGRLGEALLAGLARARREGDVAWVPDPYDPEGRPIAVPAPAGRSLTEAAQAHFTRQRRARRGLEGARRREAELRARRERLERVEVSPVPSAAAVEALESAMRREGIAVGLRPASRVGAGRERQAPVPRVEGVRLYSSSEGFAMLVGRTGKDNARLTFKLAAPDDFWLHALGVPGAHVVVRNPERRKVLPPATLREAAALAAWYSDAKAEAQADVQVARRKDVRAVRGAPPGTVLLKRASTVRVRPEVPAGVSEGASG